MDILIAVLIIYSILLAIWWIICKISSNNAISTKQRAHFDITEMLDVALMRFWRFASYCALAGLIIWLFLIGKWYLAILPLLWYVKVFWFGSIFYFPFNLIESHYMAKVELVFGRARARKNQNDRAKQIAKMKEKNWTIPDKMK